LKDHDDRSDLESEYGDGYSWHIASREDPVHFPYLEITYDRSRVHIANKNTVARHITPNTDHLLSVVCNDDSICQWTVTGPDGTDVSASTLSSLTDKTVTFRAPNICGVYTITPVCGEGSDNVFIGVATESPESPLAPIYMDDSLPLGERQALQKISNMLLEQIGRSGNLSRIDYDNGLETIRIGGTSREYGAAVMITLMSSRFQDDAPRYISLDPTTKIEVYQDSFAEPDTPKYIVLADTGLVTLGGVSGIFLFDVYDSSGERLDDQSISHLQLTIPFDMAVAGDSPFENNRFSILQTASVSDFFSEDDQIRKHTITTTKTIKVLDEIGCVTFETSSHAMFGLIAGDPSEEQNTGDTENEISGVDNSDSLGDGCFIGSLFLTYSSHCNDRR